MEIDKKKMTAKLDRKKGLKCTAANERFCVIAAVTPQIMQCKSASYYPAGSSVEAATTQSRHHVICKRRKRRRESYGIENGVQPDSVVDKNRKRQSES